MGSSMNLCQDPQKGDTGSQLIDKPVQTLHENQQQRLQSIILVEDDHRDTGNNFEEEKVNNKPPESQSKIFIQNLSKSTIQKTSKVNLLSVVVVGSKHKHGKQFIHDKLIDVPYSVVKLATSDKLRKIMAIKPQVFGIYQQPSTVSNWKLHKKGYYINYFKQKQYGILNGNVSYLGNLVEYDKEVVPDEKGTLCNQEGVYTGEFKKGLAHGEGTYIHYDNKTIFKGTWVSGYLTAGTIENQKFKYQGSLISSVANGFGKIKFSQKGEKYEGMFKQGLYSGSQNLLETQEHTYSGSFEKGKKHGYGCLVQKQRVYGRPKNLKYMPAQKYNGIWLEDNFEKRIKKEKFIQSLKNIDSTPQINKMDFIKQ